LHPGDEALAALGAFRIPIPLPFPQAGGPINVVAVEEADGGVALFDTGIATPAGEAALAAGLAARGFRFEDVRRIFVTHGHVDHYGLATTLHERSGAAVFVHPADRWKIAAPSPWEALAPRYRAFALRAGVDAAGIRAMLAFAHGEERFVRRFPGRTGELREGMRLSFARCEATVLEMPGHTPGLVCALLEAPGAGRILVADDMLLEHVSPNPILEILDDGSRFRALPAYFRSLARLDAMELDWIVPGHGACFSSHGQVIAGLRDFYARRMERIHAAVPPEGATPFELLPAIFRQIGPLELFFMLSELLGNLDLLEDAGRVHGAVEAGRLRYWRTDHP